MSPPSSGSRSTRSVATLNVLAGQGLLRRVHGGAVAVAGDPAELGTDSRPVITPVPDAATKRAMADAVIALVPAGSVVALDAGTTSEAIA